MTCSRLVLGGVLAACGLIAGILPEAKLTPKLTTPSHRELIKEGTALHDAHEYDQAIEKYDRVLAANPDDVTVLYEKSYTQYLKKDYQGCIDTATKGAGYDSPALAQFYVSLGSCYDDMGQTGKAEKVYSEALKRHPSEYLLGYNLGFTYFRHDRLDEARKTIERVLRIKPDHPSSHWVLAQVYLKTGRRIPAVMAMSRFLILEPASRRSPTVLNTLQQTAAGNVQHQGGGNILITLPDTLGRKDEEGDFGSAETALAIGVAASHTESAKEQTPFERTASALSIAFSMADAQKKPAGFARAYYAPFFAELDKRKMVETFLHYVTQSGAATENKEWLNANRDKVGEFLAWSRKYEWPKEK